MIPHLKDEIIFNEKLHRYTNPEGFVYTSVTTLIGKYHPQFDENFWAKKKAKELGISESLVKLNWKNIRDAACDRGNQVHKELEDSINHSNGSSKFYFDSDNDFKNKVVIIDHTNLDLLANTPLCKNYPEIFEYLASYIRLGWILFAEQRVYWKDFLVAGTIDCPLLNPFTKEFIIVDWKTNKDELKFKSGYFKKVNGIKTDIWIDKKEYFFYPLNFLEHCKGNIYTLQLNTYAYILELWGYKCIGLVLFHIRNGYPVTKIPILYDNSYGKKLLNHFKSVSSNPNNITNTIKNTPKFGLF